MRLPSTYPVALLSALAVTPEPPTPAAESIPAPPDNPNPPDASEDSLPRRPALACAAPSQEVPDDADELCCSDDEPTRVGGDHS